ncbi:hypothetical protein [Kitasatospora viridis]|uniref:Uncharacterized protein n=1 Tax=Kitasatospora viridis TaxID=281105 RepID=A0A561SDL9_9ACTN|nr:hypothetical protein [Kitasatospora viridis]TWF72972.1 hypothetical protein FHX73_16123 [Kitasatospora viridis]
MTCLGIVLWFVGLGVATSMNENLGTLYFFGSLVCLGAWLWKRSEPERERLASQARHRAHAQEAAELRQRQERERAEVERWRAAHTRAAAPEAGGRFRPGPVGLPAGLGGALMVSPAELPTGQLLALPDVDQARRVFRGTVTAVVRSIDDEARGFVRELDGLPDGGCEPGRLREQGGELGWKPAQNGSRLTGAAADLVSEVLAWADVRRRLLKDFWPDPAVALGQVEELIEENGDRVRVWGRKADWNGPGPAVLPGSAWPDFLTDLRDRLTRVSTALGDLSAFPLPPALSPPPDAKFAEHVSASAATDTLSAFLVEAAARSAALSGGPMPPQATDWGLGAYTLNGFLTEEIRDRFHRAVAGSPAVAEWAPELASPQLRHRLHLCYLAFALGYLTEVSKGMQDYTERSGSGKPAANLTVMGSIGSVQIAESIQIIGSNLAAIMDRGSARTAEAIRALSQAIQQEPALSDDQRVDLLHHLADVAEAVSHPEDGRRRSRVRPALTAIAEAGAAVGAGSPISRAVTDWQHVLSALS